MAAIDWLDPTKPVKRGVGGGREVYYFRKCLNFSKKIINNNLRSKNIESSQNILFIKMKTSKLSNYFLIN